jgi:hypothetical protein
VYNINDILSGTIELIHTFNNVKLIKIIKKISHEYGFGDRDMVLEFSYIYTVFSIAHT